MTSGAQRQFVETVLSDGKIESNELEALRSQFGDGSNLTRDEADLLVELFKRVERKGPGFEDYFFKTIGKYVVGQGKVNAELASWLRRLLQTKGVSAERQRKFINELRGETDEVSPDLQTLFDECLKPR